MSVLDIVYTFYDSEREYYKLNCIEGDTAMQYNQSERRYDFYYCLRTDIIDYFNHDGVLLHKDYQLVNNEGIIIDPEECDVFMYRHDYSIFKNSNELLNHLKIKNFLN